MTAGPELLPLPEVLTLLEKATPGEWEADGDDANYHEITICGNDRYACSVGIWQVPRAMGLHDEPERVANAAAIVAAVNYLRTHGANLAGLQREVEALRAEVRQQKEWLAWWGRFTSRQATLAEQAEARAERLAGALQERRDWFEAQAKSISKGNGPSWDLMQVREQRDLCEAALDQETTNG